MITFRQPEAAAQPVAPSVVVDRMADKMLEMGMNGTAVTVDSLFEHSDFTRDQIEAHGRAAADLARRRSIRRLD